VDCRPNNEYAAVPAAFVLSISNTGPKLNVMMFPNLPEDAPSCSMQS
jgi:hypothetical protein